MVLGVASKATNLLDDVQIDYEVYDAGIPDPTITKIRETIVFFVKEKADFTIAIGGDSTIYLGKGI